MISISKEGRQAIRHLEFGWNHDRCDFRLSLRDCLNLQSLYIGLDHIAMWKLRLFNENKSKHQKVDVWDWRGEGKDIWKVLSQLPHGLTELKVREVDKYSWEGRISRFFEGPINPVYTHSTLIEKYEAELKENLGYLRKGRRLAAIDGQMKRRRAR